MDLTLFNAVENKLISNWKLLAQDKSEWRFFLEFVGAYFENRNIIKPVVVEIGLMKNSQRDYYKELFNAEHIGIDVNINAEPDILGDSQEPATVETLKGRLSGHKIDLLFIDGDHSYKAAKRDYELFSPLVKHLIAFHDTRATNNSEVSKLWAELIKDRMSIEFYRGGGLVSIKQGMFVDMGIGLLIKEEE